MNKKVLAMLIVAASFAAGGCTTLTDYGSVRKEALRNDQGHVVGYKEMLRNERTGEVIAQVSMYAPLLDHSGAIIGYEEHAKDGTIIRDLDGRSIGGRFADLRSRGTNAKNKGLMIVMRPADSQQLAAAQPKIWQLMASLSASDLRRVQ
jgi:cytochrome c556